MKTIITTFILFFISQNILAEEFIQNDLKKLGKAKLTFLIFDVYEAELYGEKPEAGLEQSLSLKLTYLRDFKAKDIIKQSLKEFKTIGVKPENMSQWEKYLAGMFPDVKKGDTLTATFHPKKGVKIYLNEKEEYSYRQDLAFSKDFMGIWLSPKTSEPKLRRKLFGIDS